jgi:hypothetical protein
MHDMFSACKINKNLFINYIRKIEEGYVRSYPCSKIAQLFKFSLIVTVTSVNVAKQ